MQLEGDTILLRWKNYGFEWLQEFGLAFLSLWCSLAVGFLLGPCFVWSLAGPLLGSTYRLSPRGEVGCEHLVMAMGVCSREGCSIRQDEMPLETWKSETLSLLVPKIYDYLNAVRILKLRNISLYVSASLFGQWRDGTWPAWQEHLPFLLVALGRGCSPAPRRLLTFQRESPSCYSPRFAEVSVLEEP